MLLERADVNPNQADIKYGLIPLMWAAEDGHEGVVNLLLERGDINPDILSLSGETALELAAFWGQSEVVELLSMPNQPLPVPTDTDEIPEHPSSEPSCLLQSPFQPISSAFL